MNAIPLSNSLGGGEQGYCLRVLHGRKELERLTEECAANDLRRTCSVWAFQSRSLSIVTPRYLIEYLFGGCLYHRVKQLSMFLCGVLFFWIVSSFVF